MRSTNVNYPSSEQVTDVLFTVEACGGRRNRRGLAVFGRALVEMSSVVGCTHTQVAA